MVRHSRTFAAYLMTTQRRLQRIDSRRSGLPKGRERLTVPRRSSSRPSIPAWSPRAEVERRPMRLMRFGRDLW